MNLSLAQSENQTSSVHNMRAWANMSMYVNMCREREGQEHGDKQHDRLEILYIQVRYK